MHHLPITGAKRVLAVQAFLAGITLMAMLKSKPPLLGLASSGVSSGDVLLMNSLPLIHWLPSPA